MQELLKFQKKAGARVFENLKDDFPKSEEEVVDSLNRALDDVRKGRTRRVF